MPTFGTDLHFAEICKRTIRILQYSDFCFLERGLHVCVDTSISMRANFKSDFISFPVHGTSLSRLFQSLKILSQQVHLCPEQLK